jgi:hypothetical protein
LRLTNNDRTKGLNIERNGGGGRVVGRGSSSKRKRKIMFEEFLSGLFKPCSGG